MISATILRRSSRHYLNALRQSQPQRLSLSSASASASASATKTAILSAPQSTSSSSSSNLATATIGGLIITLAGGFSYVFNNVGGSTEDLSRTLSFYKLAIPAYVTYRAHQILQSDDATWEELDRTTSKAGLDKILSLGGFYIKSGQMCASNIGNAFPKIWQDTMSVLQDQCPYKPISIVKQILESEYGKPMDEIFASFEEVPIGSASIGQVHRATLRDGGHHVVVKVQYPEVEKIFRGDVRTIKMFAQIAQPVHVPPLNEIEKQFMTEFDYRREAEQMERVRKNLVRGGLASAGSKHKHYDSCLAKVPRAYLHLCTKRVLVMEELKGEKLAVALKHDLERHAARIGKTVEEFIADQQKKMRLQLQEYNDKNTNVNCDDDSNSNGNGRGKSNDSNQKDDNGTIISNQGPTAKEFDAYIKLMDAKRKTSNVMAMLHNYSVGFLPGFQRKEYAPINNLPINHAKIMDDLIHVHGHEVLVDGDFNGDPHPGNILLLGVENGKNQLGLIDYGQVKQLSTSERHLMCKIVIALANDDRADIIRLMKEAGFKSRYMDEDVIYRYTKVNFDEDNPELLDGKHIQMFMEDLQAKDPIEAIPDQFLMVGRVSIMLRGLAHMLNQSRSMAQAWKPIAEKVLREEGGDLA